MQLAQDDGFFYCDADILEKAQNGDSFAQLEIGRAYDADYQMENNCSLAFEWISLSAQQGNMEAQFRLGDLYALGQGTEQCHTRAYEWYTKSALQGYNKALTRIHNLYEDDKFMHFKGYQNNEERSRWSPFYLLQVTESRGLNEYRLQHSIPIQNQAMKFYQQLFNTFIQQKGMTSAGSQLQLGFMYQHGYGTKRNINKAIECYINAAKEGIIEAHYNLGEIYLNKKQSTENNAQEAFEWFSKAAENGSTIAQCRLAHLYEKGIGAGKDYAKALHWYSLAANMRCTSAQLSIARIYRTGQGVLKDYKKAIEWYNCAAKGGNRAAQNCLDQLHAQDEMSERQNSSSKPEYYKNPINGRRMNSLLRQHISECNGIKKVEKLKTLAMNAMKRDINAMYDIGIKYRDGVDLPQDSDLSVKWIKKAARGGLEKAQLTIGKMYEEGELVEQDYHRASIWYKKKPLRKNDTFQYKLGMMYYEGKGVRQDYLEASKWFIKSSEKGNTDSQCQLGYMRNYGQGLRQDKYEAFELFRKAANQGNGDAMYRLGRMYFHGEAVEKNSQTALFWYRRALNYGCGYAGCELIKNYNDYKDELKDLETTKLFLGSSSVKTGKAAFYYDRAKCYLKGFIVKQDYFKAYKSIKKSIALYAIDRSRWFSTPVKPEGDINGSDLLNMYRLVSEKGIDNLEYNVGYAYEFGLRGDYSYMTPVKINISKAIEWYMIALKKGDTRAGYRLGVIYEEGNSVAIDLSASFDFYSKAIEKENINAMYRLANLYLRGKGVTQNFEKAYQLFTCAHNMGQCYSCLFLKILKCFPKVSIVDVGWSIGNSTEEDDQNELLYYSNENESNLLSLKMLEEVGRSGNVAVQYQLGCLYGDSGSDDSDYSKAIYWLDLASRSDITDAYYRLGRMYEEGQGVEKNYSQSLTLYEKAVAKEHDEALYRLARMHQHGLGTPVDSNKALVLYKKSAEYDNDKAKTVFTLLKCSPDSSHQETLEENNNISSSEADEIISMYEHIANDGNATIQFELGYYYENNQLEPNYSQAAKWYSMAKNLGHIDATYRLGRLCELGLGTVQNYGYAFELYTIARNGGLSEAALSLGRMFQNGLGVNVDLKKAFDYYTEASEKGNSDAQFKLGQIYDQGLHNSPNILEALKWYTRSYLKGNDAAGEYLYLFYDDDEPYEDLFYRRMAKILLGYASNKDYHLKERIDSGSDIYTRLFHAYLHGQGVQKNIDLAWQYLSISVELNSHPSRLIFSKSVYHIIKDNISEIYEMALKQSENNDKNACILLGTLCLGGVVLMGETKEGNKKVYSSIFEDAIDLSDNSSYNENLSIGIAIVKKDYERAFKYFSKVANADNAYAKLLVAQMYHCGYGTKQNLIKASEYYHNLIGTNYFEYIAEKCLGHLYACGEGVKQDNDQALYYAKKKMFIKSQYLVIAQIFYCRDEIIGNYKTSLKYLLRASSTPHWSGLCLIKKVNDIDPHKQPDSVNGVYSLVYGGAVDGEIEYLLGIMYEKGQGTRVNYKEAFDRFSKAVKYGNKRAENHLELYYKDGKFIE